MKIKTDEIASVIKQEIAQYAAELKPLIEEILLLPLPEIIALLRKGIRAGTWDVHVLAEVKSALSMASATKIGQLP